MTFDSFYEGSLKESSETKIQAIESCREPMRQALEILVDSYRGGGKTLFCGNGGSAADAQHLATELMIRLSRTITRPALGAISLSTDPSNMTAGGNDIGFDQIFARNVEGLGRAGDVLLAISTSGESPNIVNAVRKATSIDMRTIGLLGGTGGALARSCDVAIVVPSTNTQRIQETHITLGHILCELLEDRLYGAGDE